MGPKEEEALLSSRGTKGGPSIDSKASAADSEHSLLGLSHIRKSPNWSFSGKPPPDADQGVPGPGTYGPPPADATSRFSKGPRFTFGASAREVLAAKMPGPGAYTPREAAPVRGPLFYARTEQGVAAKAPSAEGRQKSGEDSLPGPGAHEVPTRFGEGPKFSCSPRTIQAEKLGGPGPGAYDVAETLRGPRCHFGTPSKDAKERDIAAAAAPGPGAYTISTLIGNGPKVSIKSRFQAGRAQVTPGPGAHGGHYTSFGDYKPSVSKKPHMASATGSGRSPAQSISSR